MQYRNSEDFLIEVHEKEGRKNREMISILLLT